jgi:hypothetical protein
MQKISSYLYSNRLNVIADLASYPVEWRLVYQRTIKLYKGMKNVVEFDIRNADQKRINLSGYNIKCVILDHFNTEISTLDVDMVLGTTGLATTTIPASVFDYIKPQFLKYTLYILNDDGSKTPFYGDTQFGVGGTIDLLNGVVAEEVEPQVIKTFNYVNNDGLLNPTNITYFSSAVEVNPRNDINDQHRIRLDFVLLGLDAEIVVQASTDAVVSAGTIWKDLETFQVVNSTESVIKTYAEIDDYSNNIGWLRIQYTPETTNTGSIDKIVVRA